MNKMQWFLCVLFTSLLYLGFDYGRLLISNRKLKYALEGEIEYPPTRYIVISSSKGRHMVELSKTILKARQDANIEVQSTRVDGENGYIKTVFDNGDELIFYNYEEARIAPLTKREKEKYAHRIFFDYMLPQGAERAVIKDLGLLDYVVSIGVCTEKSGGI